MNAIIIKNYTIHSYRTNSEENNASDLYRSAAYMFTGYEYMWCVKDGDFPWKEQFYNSLENLFDIDPILRKYSNIKNQ